MNWPSITLFGSGFILGGFCALGFAVLTLGPHLKRIRLALETMAARRKPGRKAKNPVFPLPAPDSDLVHRDLEDNP